MSYVLDFVPDAQLQWRKLDVAAQEAALDLLDYLAATPQEHLAEPDVVADRLLVDAAGTRRWLFVHVVYEHRRSVLQVMGVGVPVTR
jgi:hypothetical protein